MVKDNKELNENTLNPLLVGGLGAMLGFIAGVGVMALMDKDTRKKFSKELGKLKDKSDEFFVSAQDRVKDLKNEVVDSVAKLPKIKK